MIDLHVTIYDHSTDMPEIKSDNFFQSMALFKIYENTPRIKPYMVVVTDGNGLVLSHIMGSVRYRTSIIPPFIYAHCLVMGEGEFVESDVSREVLFTKMLHALTKKLQSRVINIEFSHISAKMFGYSAFRRCGYFPVHWLTIQNSLHSKEPEERLSSKMHKRIKKALEKGVNISEVCSDRDLYDFTRLIKHHNRLKPKRYIPDARFFREMLNTDKSKLFLTKYKHKVVGCCLCVFTGNNAYLWYLASLRKSYVMIHPEAVTIWYAIKYAYEHDYGHINFMDVGLPFSNNPYREFILQFGGKPISTYRWFRFSFKGINAFLSWLYRD